MGRWSRSRADFSMTSLPSTETQIPRSSFVTVVAWVFIVLSGFAAFIGALQNLMIRSVPFDQVDSVLRDSTAASQIPEPAQFMFSNIRLLFLATFLMSFLTLVTSIGLLQRRNWARLVFMGLLILGIVYAIGSLFVQESFISSFDSSFATGAPQDSVLRAHADDFRSMLRIIRVFMTVFALGIAGLFAWIVARLGSARIRAEFTAQAT